MARDDLEADPRTAPGASGGGGPHEEGALAELAGAATEIRRAAAKKRLRRGLAVSVVTLAMITLGAELWLRVGGDRVEAFERGLNRTRRRWAVLMQEGLFEEVDDDVRRYAMRPGADCVVDDWRFRVTSHRTRGPEPPTPKPPGEKRLVALGDSFCFGMWCDEDETLVAQLARMATEAAPDGTVWRPINLGVPGYNSGQQLRALEQDGLALEPDAVLLYYNTNDIDRHGFFYDGELGAVRNDHLPLPVGLRQLLWKSHLYGWIVRKHNEALNRIPSPQLDPRVPWAHVREDNKRATADAIRGIAEVCRERGVPLFFVNQPLMTWSGDARSPDWPVLPLVEWAEGLRTEIGIPGVSLLGWMRNYSDGVDRGTDGEMDFVLDTYFADENVQRYLAGEGEFELPVEPDFHLTAEGYAHMARVVYPHMRAAGILP